MWKRYIFTAVVILIVGVLAAVNIQNNYEFKGTIESVDANEALVNITEGEILSSGDKIYVTLPDESFVVGDEITVIYDGDVMESYPLQINVIEVYK